MEIIVQVRHNQHQGIPHFESKATNWEMANRQLEEGLELIRCKNQFYKERGIYNALICGIIDFSVTDDSGTITGQFGFDINQMDKSIEELVDWYSSVQQLA
ncbi:hypothetical protein CVD28_01750 [Bacillus sp. M6-12]|uniref:hypothetical protein n=1 Tax=Bacillus sp. M6-12 TaxID=2054166 RepID=UPI000C78E79E|nr:hypothetical protein [Bacillus sp. M6-12]PLS19158.1 hypothetical protein CVD28_01750 [Bacillus sp. M6-12]